MQFVRHIYRSRILLAPRNIRLRNKTVPNTDIKENGSQIIYEIPKNNLEIKLENLDLKSLRSFLEAHGLLNEPTVIEDEKNKDITPLHIIVEAEPARNRDYIKDSLVQNLKKFFPNSKIETDGSSHDEWIVIDAKIALVHILSKEKNISLDLANFLNEKNSKNSL